MQQDHEALTCSDEAVNAALVCFAGYFAASKDRHWWLHICRSAQMVHSLWCDGLQTSTQSSGSITNMLWWQHSLWLRSADLIISVACITLYTVINYNLLFSITVTFHFFTVSIA